MQSNLYNLQLSNLKSVNVENEKFNEIYFAFLGEFGYELISWIPYLLYIKKTLNVHLNTVSRKGSKLFYYFSDNHIEVEPEYIGDMWGEVEKYQSLNKITGTNQLIFPVMKEGIAFQFEINGCKWLNNDIHKVINTENYIVPDYSNILDKLPFDNDKYVVINNKFQRQWYNKYKAPINYFTKDELKILKELLNNNGYSVIYNHFIEKTSYDQYFAWDDSGIFGNNANSIILSDYYRNLKDVESRNRLQMSILNRAEFVIGPQGGNLYLPALCKKNIFMLLRDGQYLDYLEFARIFNIELNAFYEPEHLINYVSKYIKTQNPPKNKFYINYLKAIFGEQELETFLKVPIKYDSPELNIIDNQTKIENFISICIPTYNRAHQISKAIESCLNQTYNNFEIVIIDDGSTDNTKDLIQSFNSSKIRYFYKEHSGIPDTRNLAVKNAKYDYILWLASDDWLELNTLENYNEYVNNYPEKYIFSADIRVINGESSNISVYQDWSENQGGILEYCITTGTPIADGGSLVKKDLYQKIGLYNPEMKRAQDYNFWCRSILKGEFKFQKIKGVYYNYFTQEDSSSGLDIYKKNLKYERLVIANIIKNSKLSDIFSTYDWKINPTESAISAYRVIAENFLKYRSINNSIHFLKKSLEYKFDISYINQIRLLEEQKRKIIEILPKLKHQIENNQSNKQFFKDYEELTDIINEVTIDPIDEIETSISTSEVQKHDEKSKVLIISQFYSKYGGTENLAFDLANAVYKQNYDVELAYFKVYDNHNEDLFNNNHITIKYYQMSDLDSGFELIQSNYDALILFSDINSDIALRIGQMKVESLLKFIYLNVNNSHIEEIEIIPEIWNYYKQMLELYDFTIVMSENSLAAKLLKEMEYPYLIIQSGIPEFSFDKELDYFKVYLNIDNQRPKIIYPGLITPLKMQLEFAKIAAKINIADFIFIGELFYQNEEYNNEFLDLINLNSNLYYFEPVERHKVIQLISSSELLVLPSVSEGSPLVIMEAVQVGTPWIANSQIEFAKQLPGGIVCNLDEFENNINKLLFNSILRNELSLNSKNYQVDNYNINKTAEKFLEIIKSRTEKNMNQDNKVAKKVIVAADLMKDKDLTQVDSESEFKNAIFEVIKKYQPNKLIETGTYLGEGTTRIIIESLQLNKLFNSQFYSIEVNKIHLKQAIDNLKSRGYLNKVKLLYGLSVPRNVLPTVEEIRKSTVENIEFDNIIVDHNENERALKYYQETDFDSVEDDLLGKVLNEMNNEPDFVLLDSGGHIGYVEFTYLLSKLKNRCIIALDDVNHIKHHKSYLTIQKDKRFKILYKSDEKFGFCIAEFNPHTEEKPRFDFNDKSILFVRTDSIGDSVLAMGMLKEIKEKFTSCRITVLIQNHLTELYQNCPYIDDIIPIDKQKIFTDKAYFDSFIKNFGSYHFDYSLNTIFSRDLVSDVLSTAKNINYKIGFDGDLSNIDSNTKTSNDSKYDLLIKSEGKFKQEIYHYLDFMNEIGFDNYKPDVWLWLSEDNIDYIEKLFSSYNLNKEKVISIFAGGQHSIRDYMEFNKVFNKLSEKYDFTIIALGSNREYNLHEEIFKDAKFKYINLCGKTSIGEAAAIVCNSKLAVGVETAFTHIACANDVPNITVLGGGHFGRFVPYSKKSSVVCLPLDCYNCNWKCKFDNPYCINQIDWELIFKAVEDRLVNQIDKIQIYIQKDIKNSQSGYHNNINEYLDGLDYDLIYNENVKSELFQVDYQPENEKNEMVSVKKILDTFKSGYNYKVSALVSVYNAEKYIKGAMEDLVNQSLFKQGGLEVVIIDSNSPQNEYQIIKQYLDQYPQIKYKRTDERETLYKAWNRAIDISEGEYLTSANTDDRHRTDALEILSQSLDKFHQYGLVYPDLLITHKENETFDNNTAAKRYEFPDYNMGTILSNSVYGAQPVWRRKVHDEIGYFDDNYKIGGDYELFIRLSRKFGAVHFRETLGLFLQGESALSNQKNMELMLQETYRTLNKHRRNISLEEIYPDIKNFRNDGTVYFAVIWDFGCMNMLSPYNDFDLAVEYFNKGFEFGKKTNAYQKIQKMYDNNIGIIHLCSGEPEKAYKYFKNSGDFDLIKQNMELLKEIQSNKNHLLHNSILVPSHFKISIVEHDVLTNARKTSGLFIDENKNIKQSSKVQQYFWDVYYGTGGIEITEYEKQRAINKIPRSPKTEGLMKNLRVWKDKDLEPPVNKYLTSFSEKFWTRDYNNAKKVLLKCPAAIGDALTLTAIIKNLNSLYPSLEIFVSSYFNERQIFLNNPLIKGFIAYDTYDEVIFENETDGLVTIDFTGTINKLPEYYGGISYMDIFGNIAGIKFKDRSYYYYPTKDELENAKDNLNYLGNAAKIIGVHFHSGKDERRTYPHGKELIRELLKLNPNLRFINFGIEPLNFIGSQVLDLASYKLSIREQIALAYYCNEFITIDSSFFHVGHNLVKKPTAVIFGPTSPYLCGNPEAGFSFITNENLDCLACYWQRETEIKCMTELKPDWIAKKYLEYNFPKSKYYKGIKNLTINEKLNYEEFLYDYFAKNKRGFKLILTDKNGIFPEFSNNWNGIEIIR